MYRTPRQCRERWINSIDPKVSRKKWTLFEDEKILALWSQMGPKWHEIAKNVDRRTEIQVKNRFNCILKKNDEMQAATKQEHVTLCLKKV